MRCQSFDSYNISIRFIGFEQTKFTKTERHYHKDLANEYDVGTHYTVENLHLDKLRIVDTSFCLVDLADGPVRYGQYSIPFTLNVPEELPASFVFETSHEKASLRVHYILRAQFTPKDAEFVEEVDGDLISKISVSKAI